MQSIDKGGEELIAKKHTLSVEESLRDRMIRISFDIETTYLINNASGALFLHMCMYIIIHTCKYAYMYFSFNNLEA